ncbi:hypothetical protein SM139_0918 [Stenotrophomonas maltophilia]|nr:hypothetical protein SM139_0918 [Stenotrophomonas maltophilia]
MKRVTGTYSAPRPHWVGDGFPARSMFSYNTHGQHLSPFLLLDYAGPYTFAPSDTPRGSASIRIAVSRPSPSSMRARSPTAIQPAPAAPSARVTCSG